MRRLIGLLLSALLLLCGAVPALAGDCHPPGPFSATNAIRGAANFVPGTGSACDIVATLNPANSSTAAAFAWYSLGAPQPRWRISFRIDLSELGVLQNFVDSIHFLSASVRPPSPESNNVASLLNIYMFQVSADSGPTFAAAAGCSTQSGSVCYEIQSSSLKDGDLLRFEVATGAGSAGYVHWWINADFDDSPTGGIENLDNSEWRGVDTVTLGAFQPDGALATNGTSLRFYDVEEPDEFVFGNGFDG